MRLERVPSVKLFSRGANLFRGGKRAAAFADKNNSPRHVTVAQCS